MSVAQWTKVGKSTFRGGRDPIDTPRVSKGKTGATIISWPESMVKFDAVNIYTDGGDSIAFHFCDGGEYRVSKRNTKCRASKNIITQRLADGIPLGTHEVTLVKEGDFLVLDKSQFSAFRVAAE